MRYISEKVISPLYRGEDQDLLPKWKDFSLKAGLAATEFLVPRIEWQIEIKPFPFERRRLAISDQELLNEAKRLAPWTYHLDVPTFDWRQFGTYNAETVRFHRFRSHLISGTVAKMLGSGISATDVLDIGCNCGFFTMDLADRGVRYATGIDVRQKNIDQAIFLRHALGLGNASFITGNAKSLEVGEYDVVLNLGLMYHLSTPFEVMQSCYRLAREFCVVDTIAHKEPYSGCFIADKNIQSPIEGDLRFEFQPTYRGILDIMRMAGFKWIVELVGVCDDPVDLYRDCTRRCLIGFKKEPTNYIENVIK